MGQGRCGSGEVSLRHAAEQRPRYHGHLGKSWRCHDGYAMAGQHGACPHQGADPPNDSYYVVRASSVLVGQGGGFCYRGGEESDGFRPGYACWRGVYRGPFIFASFLAAASGQQQLAVGASHVIIARQKQAGAGALRASSGSGSLQGTGRDASRFGWAVLCWCNRFQVLLRVLVSPWLAYTTQEQPVPILHCCSTSPRLTTHVSA